MEFFAPEIFTDSKANPAVCKIVATIESISSASSLLIPVTSTKRFFVLVVTVVTAALMIGGRDTVFSFSSNIIGT